MYWGGHKWCKVRTIFHENRLDVENLNTDTCSQTEWWSHNRPFPFLRRNASEMYKCVVVSSGRLYFRFSENAASIFRVEICDYR
jgi:hypothetical protein